MQVDNTSSQARMATEALEATKASTPKPQDKGATGQPVTGSSDKVSLTSEAAQMHALESEIAQLPVVDTKRVQEVQNALATGSFQVDPAKVAEKMLNFESGLT